jgi:anti-sigma B factor antagonist
MGRRAKLRVRQGLQRSKGAELPGTSSQDIPAFEINSASSAGYCIVRVIGELDMAHEEELRDELNSAIESDQHGVLVDLSECDFIDSSGVRSLLLGREAQAATDSGNRGFALVTSNEQVLRILSVMGVDKMIPVRPTIEEAITALGG